MPIESVRIAFLDDSIVPKTVDGVLARIFTVDGILVTQATSGTFEPGVATLDLEGDVIPIEYEARFYMRGSAIDPKRILVYSPSSASPSLTNDFLVTVDVFNLEPAIDPMMCRASGQIVGPEGTAYRGIDITVIPKFRAFVRDERIGLSGRFIVRADKFGYASVDLFRFGIYDMIIEGREAVHREVIVPNRSSVLLAHLLFPRVIQVNVLEAPPYTVASGEVLYLTPRVWTTDFRNLGLGYDDVLYEVEDSSIASVQVMSDRIAIRGIRAGTTRLRISRRDESVVYIPDYAITGGVVPIVVAG